MVRRSVRVAVRPLRRAAKWLYWTFIETLAGLFELSAPAWSSWNFTEVHQEAGVVYEHRYDSPSVAEWSAGGVAAGDYDGDGWVDLYVVRGDAGPNLLFRNRGDGTFEEVGAQAGVALLGERSVGPSFADFDGDGHLDLLVLALLCPPKYGYCDGREVPQTGRIRLFRNRGNGRFEDVTQRSGLRFTRDCFSASWGDYDADGDLDLFVTHWGDNRPPGSSEHLWRNNGDGTFTDVSTLTGITSVFSFLTGDIGDLSFTANFADLDSDGWPDLLVAGDFRQSKALRNLAGAAFSDVTSPVISDENGMGAAVGDYDNDGDLDWFVSSIWDPDGDSRGNNWYVSGNRLYRNSGDGTFQDVTDAANVRRGWWGWGATFADLDLDGWLDLYHVNGRSTDDPEAYEFHHDPAVLFHNRRNGTFQEIAGEVGVADRGQGRGVVAFDYDRDGDVDLFVANIQGAPALYRNDLSPKPNFLNVRLRGRGLNSEGIGARVWIEANGTVQMRELRAGNNFVSQDPAEAHFGLGSAQRVTLLRVRWPSGAQQEWCDLPVNAWLRIWEGSDEFELMTRLDPPPGATTHTPASSLMTPSPTSATATPPPESTPPIFETEPLQNTATRTPSSTSTPSTTAPLSPTASPTPLPSASPTPKPPPCLGDCSDDGEVTIDELILLVAIALGEADIYRCPTLARSGISEVTIDSIVRAVGNALFGCARPDGLPYDVAWHPLVFGGQS